MSRQKAVEVSWYSWFVNMIRRAFGNDGAIPIDPEATAEYPSPSSLTLIPGVWKLLVGVVSTVGNYREHNEDNYYVPGRSPVQHDAPSVETTEQAAATLESKNLFIVADGMGGQQAGEQASLMAVEIIPKALARRLPPDVTDPAVIQTAIREAVAEANQEILGCSGAVTEYSSMGTTMVLALFRQDRVYVAGIGDSPAYRLRDGKIEQLTKEHSLARALKDAGTITEEELQNHKFRNVLYLYLGCPDARSGPEEIRELEIQPGDRFLLASDGLTGVVRDEEIARIVESYNDPQRSASALKERALANDSKDNVTCLVIHVVGDRDRPPVR